MTGAAAVRAFEALGRFGPLARDAIPGLKVLLTRNDPLIQSQTSKVLAAIGPDGKDAGNKSLPRSSV
jgi:hypothetical protein